MDAQEYSIYSAVLITAIVLSVIILYFVLSIVRQQRRNLELHRRNILAEITTLEKERARVAHDLHDELAPVLAAVKLQINSFVLPDGEDHEERERTNEHIDVLFQRIREISFDLLPNTLLRKGLVGAASEFVSYIGKHTSMQVHFDPQPIPTLSEQKTINLYRILQEVVHNTMKHAGASALHISISAEKNRIILSTKDNGAGFDYEALMEADKGIGLRSMRSRVEIMNGEMFVESRKGKGTSYLFQIPV